MGEQRGGAKSCVEGFPALQSLIFKVSSFFISLFYQEVEGLRALEQNLGVAPRMDRVSSTDVETWYFEAPKGGTLEWKDTESFIEA